MHYDEDLIGWRARIGLIVPDSLVPTEPWFYRVAPRGVIFLTSRMTLGKKATADALKKMKDEALRAACQLANAEVDLISFCCTSGSFIEGVGYDQQIIKEIEDETGIPATTTTTAFLDAFKILNIKSLVLVTPYIEEINLIEKNFLEKLGFKIVNIGSLNIEGIMKYTMTTAGELYRLAKNTLNKSNEADGTFISCMSMRAMDTIQALEYDTKKPVVTSNQATLWKILNKAGVYENVNGYGQLLEKHIDASF